MINLFNLTACSTCRVSMIEGGGDAAGYSIFALLIVVLAVLGGVGFFMVRLIRRENDNLDPELRDDYVSQ
jgi:hypothetical protein